MKDLKRNMACGMLLVVTAAVLCGAGCARPSKITEQVATINPPPPTDLQVGPTPMGGPSESPTGAGAGGAGAAGYEAGRVGGALPQPVTPKYPYGITYSRMSPVNSDGSSIADRGAPLPADQPLVPSNAVGVSQQLTPAPGQVPVNVDTHSTINSPLRR